MHRYEELERLYYKKLFLRYGIFIIMAILAVSAFWVFKNQKNLHCENQKYQKKFKTENKTKKTVKKVKSEKKIKPLKKTLPVKQVESNNKKPVKTLHFILPEISKESKAISKIQTKNKTGIKKSTGLNQIKITETVPDLKTLIKKFNQTQDFDLAILIAKKYFKKGDLKNAQIWALTANNINPSSYKSWVLFADILLKKKKIKKAEEILKVYTDSYGQNDIIEEKLRSLNDK